MTNTESYEELLKRYLEATYDLFDVSPSLAPLKSYTFYCYNHGTIDTEKGLKGLIIGLREVHTLFINGGSSDIIYLVLSLRIKEALRLGELLLEWSANKSLKQWVKHDPQKASLEAVLRFIGSGKSGTRGYGPHWENK